MARKRDTAEEIIGKLRAVEVKLVNGQNAQQACREIGVTEQTYYHWRKEYEGLLRLDQAARTGSENLGVGPGATVTDIIPRSGDR